MPPRQADDPLAALRAAVVRRDAGAISRAVAGLPTSPDVVTSLLDELGTAAVTQQLGEAAAWRDALAAFLPCLTEEQLRAWRWDAKEDHRTVATQPLELVPWLLYRSCEKIRDLHFEQLLAAEARFDELYQHDPQLSDEGYMEAGQEMALEAMWATDDSLAVRDPLLRPLLRAAVAGGAACLPLAEARKLDEERQGGWGGAGAWWADEWAPEPAAHAAFHPRFRAAVRALLLASHRGLPGTAPDGGPVHLPAPLLLQIVRAMAGRDKEAAWVPLARVPAEVNLNRCL